MCACVCVSACALCVMCEDTHARKYTCGSQEESAAGGDAEGEDGE